ncbi:MAG: hypothetical protein LAO06_00085 [Acidobacteriia bacterium]|nr:hypothetical protein [Terriglobia bacterium]
MSEAKDESGRPQAEGEISLETARLPETMYDRSDLAARGIVWFLILLAVTIVAIHLISWGLLRYFARNRGTPAPRNAAVVPPAWPASSAGNPVLRFPAPQLQPDPVADLNKFRAAQEEQLDSYGWVDQKNGVAHIPVERAIDIVSQQGLPVRAQPVLPPRASFGSGDGTPAGAGGGTEPRGNQ